MGMAINLLTTIGIAMPDDFPMAPFEAIHARIVPLHPKFATAVSEYFGAENGVAYRFRACCEYSDHFAVRDSTPEERHVQEKDLFGFFVSGFSVIESFCYGAFMVGAMIDPTAFAIATDKDLRNVTPESTKKAFKTSKLAGEPIDNSLSGLLGDNVFKEWKVVRNVIAHRETPGRDIYLSCGGAAGPAQPSIWKAGHGVELHQFTTSTRRAWLAKQLTTLMVDLERAASAYLKPAAGKERWHGSQPRTDERTTNGRLLIGDAQDPTWKPPKPWA